MSAGSDYIESEILKTYFTDRTTFVGLFLNGDPGDTGKGTPEVSSGNYERKEASWVITTNIASLKEGLLWQNLPGGTYAAWAVFDAKTGGNMLVHAPFVTSKVLATGDAFATDAGALTISVD